MIREFKDLKDVIDIHKNGIRFYVFCTEAPGLITSTLNTFDLFAGGLGSSKYIPMVGSQVPQHMSDANVKWIESFMQIKLVKRIIHVRVVE